MEFGEAHGELLADREHHFGEQRRSVGVEEPIQGPADPIVAKLPHLSGREPKQGVGEADGGLLLAVDRFALDDDRAQEHPERLGVRHRAAPIARGDVSVEERLEADALEEVVDEG
jgi:hypothetical protein